MGANRCSLQRIGQPEEYAELITYLAAGASYITAQVVLADGGYSF
ncbi:SDR family oxidoreductase [Mesorhizobium sp. IMUNJ 23033]